MAGPAIKTAAFTADIAIAASGLPDPLHGDPADRLLIATARHLSMPIITRDAKIVAYAAAGHVSAIPC
jgi:PIN domain nuclease of toxin-antitoxin system